MFIKRHRVNLAVTSTDGAAQSFYSDYFYGGGYIQGIHYRPDTASGISTGAHLTITGELSGALILSVSATGEFMRFPHGQAVDASGAAFGYSSAATPPAVPCRIPLAQERVKIEVSSAGGQYTGDGWKGIVDLYLGG